MTFVDVLQVYSTCVPTECMSAEEWLAHVNVKRKKCVRAAEDISLHLKIGTLVEKNKIWKTAYVPNVYLFCFVLFFKENGQG